MARLTRANLELAAEMLGKRLATNALELAGDLSNPSHYRWSAKDITDINNMLEEFTTLLVENLSVPQFNRDKFRAAVNAAYLNHVKYIKSLRG